jgi:adenosylcobinamide-GDP ribazoletransferase
MTREYHLFLSALMFYTRIPIPGHYRFHESYLQESSRYFVLIGWIIGGIAWGSFELFHLIFHQEISIALSMLVTIRATGAFHEDGLADVCDGLGGGWDKEKILTIMKDSRLGTFGVLGLISIIGIKFMTLNSISSDFIGVAMILGHVLSRMTAIHMMRRGRYVGNFEQAKSGSAAHKPSLSTYLTNILLTLPCAFFIPHREGLLVIVGLWLLELYAFRYFNKWIKGYNGDCLGALQQVSEVFCYLAWIVIWKYI